MAPAPPSQAAITPRWRQVEECPNSRSRALLESFLEWCARTWCDDRTLRHSFRGRREGPKITMAKTLIEILEISSLGQVGDLSGGVEGLHRTLSGKSHQPLQAAASGTYTHLARDFSFTMHRAQSPGDDPVARFGPLCEGYRPPLGDQGGHLTSNR